MTSIKNYVYNNAVLCYNLNIMDISKKLIKLRKENELSQAALAQKLGIGQATICQWEKGIAMPSCEYLCKIAKEFEVSTDYLLGLKDDSIKQLAMYRNTTTSQNQLLNMFKQLNLSQKECVFKVIDEFIRSNGWCKI